MSMRGADDGAKTYTASFTVDGRTYTDGKTEVLPATGEPDTPDAPDTPSQSGSCKWCGKDHSVSFRQRIVSFFHSILYFFAHLFGQR